jgi:hypothetical protein
MNRWRALVVAVGVAGLLCGPRALHSAEAAQPPLEWSAVGVAFVGAALAVLFAVGLQVLMRKPASARLTMRALSLCAVFFTASGAVALVIASLGGSVQAPSMFILSVGVGALLGAAISTVISNGAFAT